MVLAVASPRPESTAHQFARPTAARTEAPSSFLEDRGLPNFYTPENAVEAFSFLCAYRRNQAQLLEVPGAISGSSKLPPPDLVVVNAIRDGALAGQRAILTEQESKAVLAAFGLPVPRTIVAADRAAGVATDPVFGPAISFGAGGVAVEALRVTAIWRFIRIRRNWRAS